MSQVPKHNKYYMLVRTKLRNQLLNFLGAFAKPAPSIHILNGHRASKIEPTIKDKDSYRSKLAYLKERCDFVNVEEAIEMIRDRKPIAKPVVCFTFDDGYEDCYTTIAPVLEEFGVNAVFFINPSFVDAADGNEEYIKHFTNNITMSPGKRPMSWDQIKDLQNRGFIIGAHTVDHYMVNHGSRNELEHQIIDCRKIIEHKLGVPCEYFAWPYGKITQANQEAVDIACETYKYVFSQSDYKHYYSFDGKVINRRQAEPWWPLTHIKYFLSALKTY